MLPVTRHPRKIYCIDIIGTREHGESFEEKF